MEILGTITVGGVCAAKYTAGQATRGIGYGMAFVGSYLVKGGNALNEWGNKQVNQAALMWAGAQAAIQENESTDNSAQRAQEYHAQQNGNEIDITAYC